MKKITILTVFLILFSIFVSSVFTESNPLLTVFEGIKVGTDFKSVEEAIEGYGLEGTGIATSSTNEFVLSALTINWLWLDNSYKGIVAPTATLIVETHDFKVKNATYHYSFLDFERELKLIAESQTEMNREETMEQLAKDLAELYKILNEETPEQ